MTLGHSKGAHVDRRRRRSWGRGAIGWAVLLSCLSAAAAQATGSPQPAIPLATGPISSGSAPIATTDLAATPPPAPSADSFARAAAAEIEPHRTGPGGTTVITEDTKQRVADVSSSTKYDIPQAALIAYKRAIIVMDKTAPECHVTWPVLAGIGQVESDQGRYGGAQVLADGSTNPHIVGIPLNGVGNVARIPDTDNGRWDSDTVWDRAVGPMQFIPSTWAVVGVDADNDGVRNPHDFDDAALAAAVYLCANDRDLSTPGGLHAAIYSYNHSESYVDTVLSLARAYANGDVAVVPNDGPAADTGDNNNGGTSGSSGHGGREHGVIVRHHPGHQPPPGGGGTPGPGPGPNPTPDPDPIVLAGFLAPCEKDATAWCIGDAQLNFGDNADLTHAQEDYDADGVVEAVGDELAGLSEVRVRVTVDPDTHVVLTIRGLPYAVIEATEPTPTDPTTADPTTADPTTAGPTTTGPATTDPTTTVPTMTQPIATDL
ncbi:MAG TPA: lytic transglycosylase domain-containing protein [Nocardioidaceae bacterium]|nr:lytic transglycosylase domain-containing protein [Nocardioidaceae bacterium]